MVKLIEQNGKFYEKCKVVMLQRSGNVLSQLILDKGALSYNKGFIKDGRANHQDLYIISSKEEIKEGDFYLKDNLFIKQATTETNLENTNKWWNKIIATTDQSLNTNLPQPSQEFIHAYVEAYNQGKQITEVLVEYEEVSVKDVTDTAWFNTKACRRINIKRLKVSSHTNIITIKKVKDFWTREEVEELIKNYDREFKLDTVAYTKPCSFTINEWINQNL